MVETAIAAGSVPPEWYSEDRMLLTILDVLRTNAERAKRKRK